MNNLINNAPFMNPEDIANLAETHVKDFTNLRSKHGLIDITDEEIEDFCAHVRLCIAAIIKKGDQNLIVTGDEDLVATEVENRLKLAQTTDSKLPN